MANKRKRICNIDDVECVWDIIFPFLSKGLNEIVALIHVCKKWNFKRLSRFIQHAVIDVKHSFRISPLIEFGNVRELLIDFSEEHCFCGGEKYPYHDFECDSSSKFYSYKKQTTCAEVFVQQINNLKSLTLICASFFDISPLDKCTDLELFDSTDISIPTNLKALELYTGSTCNFLSLNLQSLKKLVISQGTCNVFDFDEILRFRNLTDLSLKNSSILDLSQLSWSTELHCLNLLNDPGAPCYYTNFHQISQLTFLTVDLSCIDIGELSLFDTLDFLIIVNWKSTQDLNFVTVHRELEGLRFIDPECDVNLPFKLPPKCVLDIVHEK